jgi:hypothetical protein
VAAVEFRDIGSLYFESDLASGIRRTTYRLIDKDGVVVNGYSVYREGHWLIAPFDEVLPDNALTARIYDAASLSPDQFLSNSFGIIPLVEEDPEFDKNHFWRLPVDLGVVLAAFLDRAIVVPDSWSTYHVRLAKSIYARLYVQKHSRNGDTISLQPEKEKEDGRKRKR